jgi:opacity protein-like surface antigen
MKIIRLKSAAAAAMACALVATAADAEPVNAELLAAVKALTSQLADLKEEVRLTRQEAAKARAEARGLRAPAGVPRPAAYAGSGSAAPVPSAGRGDNLKAEPDWSGPYAGLAIGGVAPQISSRGSFGNTSRSGAFPPPPFNSFLESTTVGETVGRARDAVGGALTASVGYNFAVGSWGGAGLQAEGSWLDVRADQNTRTDQTGRSVTLVAGCPASICFFPTPPSVSVSAFTSSNTFRTQVEPTWLMSALLRGGALITPSTLFYAVAGLSYTKFDTGFSASGDSTGSPAATLGIGIESRISERWAVNVDYRFHQLQGAPIRDENRTSSSNMAVLPTPSAPFEQSNVSISKSKLRGDIQTFRVGVTRAFD